MIRLARFTFGRPLTGGNEHSFMTAYEESGSAKRGREKRIMGAKFCPCPEKVGPCDFAQPRTMLQVMF